MSHNVNNKLTSRGRTVESLEDLKSISVAKGSSSPTPTAHKKSVREGEIVICRKVSFPTDPEGNFSGLPDSSCMYRWDPNSTGWSLSDMGYEAPYWQEVVFVKPDDLPEGQPGRWVNAVSHVVWASIFEAPGSTATSSNEATQGETFLGFPMNPGKWYDNSNGLTSSNTVSGDSFSGGRWFAVPFMVTSTTSFSAIACECTEYLNPGHISLAVYENNTQDQLSGPGSLVPDSWTAGGVTIPGPGPTEWYFNSPLTLSPGWYWLAFCGDHRQEDGRENKWRTFDVSWFDASGTNRRATSFAHLGYAASDKIEQTTMVCTNGTQFTPYGTPPNPFYNNYYGGDGGYTETESNPIRLCLKVVGQYDTFTGENGAIYGCMNPEAVNYSPAATLDDGSCILPGGDISSYIIGSRTEPITSASGVLYDTGGQAQGYSDNEEVTIDIQPEGGFVSAFSVPDSDSAQVAMFYNTETTDTITIELFRDGTRAQSWTKQGGHAWLSDGNPVDNFYQNEQSTAEFLQFPAYPEDWQDGVNVEMLRVTFVSDGANSGVEGYEGFALYWGSMPLSTWSPIADDISEPVYSFTENSLSENEYNYVLHPDYVYSPNSYPSLLELANQMGMTEYTFRSTYPEIAAVYDNIDSGGG